VDTDVGHDRALRVIPHGAHRPFLAHVPAQGAGLHPLLRAARRVRHGHPARGVRRRTRTLLRRLGILGISSAFFIGFFHERDEPVRSSIRAFATYRLSDAGLLIATVATFELLGPRGSRPWYGAAALPPLQATAIALLFLLSAMGKSAQLPFSGWLPRAMEGPTPSSALFYGAVSIHAGLFLLLRVWPFRGLAGGPRGRRGRGPRHRRSTRRLVVRVHTDAKGALAHATLAQVGLILAEICSRPGRRSPSCTSSATRSCASGSISRRRT
jgi:hypothetical protein